MTHNATKNERLYRVKCYGGDTKWMNFLVIDNDLLRKYNDIWSKVSNSIKWELCEGKFYIHSRRS